MNRVSHADLMRINGNLSPRRWQLLLAVDRVRLATGGQLCRRFYGDLDPESAARAARRDLKTLHALGVLHRLERRIGGVRAGSTGYIYALGPVGLRLLALRAGSGVVAGRSRYEPTAGFVEHALAVTEVWIQLHEYLADHWTGERDVDVEYRVERDAWRNHLDPNGVPSVLKPDSELRVLRDKFEDRWWLEVDRATERRSVIVRKLQHYVRYYRSGHEQAREGMFPLTAWLTVTHERAGVLRELIDELPPGDRRLFRVGLLTAATPLLLSEDRSSL